MTPDTKDLVDALNAKGLTYIADLVATSGSCDIDALEEFISERTDLEISNLQELKDISDEQVEQLRQLEKSYQREMLHLTIQDATAATMNSANARETFLETLRLGHQTHSKFLYWCGSCILVVTAVYLFCITFLQVPSENIRFADTVLGFLMGNCMGAVINFFFGSSLPTYNDFSSKTKKK